MDLDPEAGYKVKGYDLGKFPSGRKRQEIRYKGLGLLPQVITGVARPKVSVAGEHGRPGGGFGGFCGQGPGLEPEDQADCCPVGTGQAAQEPPQPHALEAEAGARTLSGKAWGEGALTRNPNLNVLERLS